MSERDIFTAARELTDPQARSAYLDRACGEDAGMKARVEALLRAHDRPDSLLDRPAPGPHDPATEATLAMEHEGVAATDDEVPLEFLGPPGRPDSLGRIGHYEVLQALGRGGFGIVLRAFDDMLHRVVAVKVLSPPLAATSPARKRFLREARSSAQVRHENVVQVYEVGEQPLPYLVMEFILGETLQQRLDRTGPLDVPEVLRIGRQVAEGLAAAHATDLIHRDIKPGNVLLEGGTQKVKLTDFGLARAADDASLSQSGLIAGTPMFMAPEQALGETLDQRADLFSLGSVLYTMVSGRPPFRASGTLAVLKRVAEDKPRPIREVIPETPQWLCDIIAKLHAKRPQDRFQSAREVADLLGRCLAEIQRHGATLDAPAPRPTTAAAVSPARPISDAAPATRRAGARPRRRAAAALLMMLFGGLGLSEATGVTDVRSTVIRLFSPEGTLVVEVDDPGVSVKIDGSDVSITGAGAGEIRLRPGRYSVAGVKDGKVVAQELVTVTNNGKRVVRVSQEPMPPGTRPADAGTPAVNALDDWIKAVALLPAEQQAYAVIAKLMERNPGFEGHLSPDDVATEGGVVTRLNLWNGANLTDISPVRALGGLQFFGCRQPTGRVLADLSPLRGLELTSLELERTPVSDLSPLRDMTSLRELTLNGTKVTDLSPLAGLKLTVLNLVNYTPVSDLSPLKAMTTLSTLSVEMTDVSDLSPLKDLTLTSLECGRTRVTDLSPLSDMPLAFLNCGETPVSDLSPIRGMPLKRLTIFDTGVTDLEPLRGMPLEEVLLTPQRIVRGLDVLRDMRTLRDIGVDWNPQPSGQPSHWPAAEFWDRYDRGEFKK